MIATIYRQSHPIEYEAYVCKACSIVFQRRKRKDASSLCLDCRRRGKSARITCSTCGVGFAGSKQQSYCSRRCKMEGQRIDRRYICEWCAKPFVPKTKHRRFCSPRCRSLIIRDRIRKSLAARRSFRKIISFRSKIRFCPICGWPFLAKGAKKTCGAHDVRQIRMNVVEREQFSRQDIFVRDHWICGICETSVFRNKKAPHPKSPSLDHIIPLARGGTHTKANVQCACLGCNIRKGTKLYKMIGDVA